MQEDEQTPAEPTESSAEPTPEGEMLEQETVHTPEEPRDVAAPDPVSADELPAAVEQETDEELLSGDEPVEPVEIAAEHVVEDVKQEAEAAAEATDPEASPELVAAVEEAFVDVEESTTGVDASEQAEAAPLPEWIPGDWYVVHTYAGYENKVKADLETRVASMNMEESIYEVVIPMEEVMENKGGKRIKVERKVFPGYLLVRMDLNDDSWYVVRNTPGVTGFVGSGNKPIPLSEKEVDKILLRKEEAERPKPLAEWSINDPVRVTGGPFANFQGLISDVDGERQKVKVLVNIFGRETPVELGFDQIAKG